MENKQKQKKIFIAIWTFTILIVIFFIGIKVFINFGDKDIVLKATPLNPTEFLNSDSAVLNYEISNFLIQNDDEKFSLENIVYVTIGTDEDYVYVKDISKFKPKNEKYIIGMIEWISYPEIRVKYGIEKFPLSDEIREKYEKQEDRSSLDVKIGIDRYGNAQIKGIIFDN